jgi:hypothetical protein
MPPLPGQTFTTNEFGTNVTEPATNVALVLGYSSIGTSGAPNVPVAYSRIPDLVAGQGQGPAVEDAAFILSNVGGTVVFMPTTCSVAGSLSAVVQTGPAGPTVTVAGTPNDDYQAIAQIVLGGALGVSKFKYTLDNGRTYSEEITVPSGGTFLFPNTGVTATFAAGTHVVGTTHTFSGVAPMWNAANLGTAFTALSTPPYAAIEWDFALGSGAHATAAAAATQFAGMQTQLSTLASTYFRHKGGMCDVSIDSAANVITSFGSVVGVRTLGAYGGFVAPSAKPFQGWSSPQRRAVGAFGYLAARSLISTDLKRVKSGPIPGCLSISHDGYLQDAGLNNIKISTLRTYPNGVGFFPTQGHLKSQAGSDFRYWQHRRLMDVACNYVYAKQTTFIGGGFNALADGTGRIDPGDAESLESEVNEGLRALLRQPTNAEGKQGHVSAVSYRIDRNANVLSTGILVSQVTITALIYIDGVATTFSYSTAQPTIALAA